MGSGLSISVIISTCNRASTLRQTLETLGKVRISTDRQVELIVVDNASVDETGDVIRSAKIANLKLEYLYEAAKGKSNALNTALRRAQGEIILFTDDDVFVSEDWVETMADALVQNEFDAVVGTIVLAKDLVRPWLSSRQKWFLAAPEDQLDEELELIGANMGFRRSALRHVPGFDPELGPGAIGLGEETLFGKRLVEAGLRLGYARNAVVVHRPDPSRLRRRGWLDMARKTGSKFGYLRYHWEHEDIWAPRLKWLWYTLKLHLRRIVQPPPPLESEGIPAWEMSYVESMETCRQFSIQRRRPRKYLRHGSPKRTAFVHPSQPRVRSKARGLWKRLVNAFKHIA
jgi:glycosyltransferase involved in cell wall biosynthesis